MPKVAALGGGVSAGGGGGELRMGNRIVRVLEQGAEKLGKTLGDDAGKAVQDLYHSTGKNLTKVAENTAEADAKHAGDLEKILQDSRRDLPGEPQLPGGGGDRPGGEEPSLSGAGGSGQSSEGNGSCQTGGDPVDVVSGQMIASATDVELFGLLPLVLRRAYASGYAGGGLHGPRCRVIRGVGQGGHLSALFHYDTVRRVTTVTDSLGYDTEYHYDEQQRVTRTVDPLGHTTLTGYDTSGRLVFRTDEINRTTGFDLDDHGDPVRISEPDGSVVELSYNDLRRLASVRRRGALIAAFTYDPHGNLLTTTDAAGAMTTRRYGAQGRLGLSAGPNPYVYVPNPLFWIDQRPRHAPLPLPGTGQGTPATRPHRHRRQHRAPQPPAPRPKRAPTAADRFPGVLRPAGNPAPDVLARGQLTPSSARHWFE
jgi:YD repeat-containing protein